MACWWNNTSKEEKCPQGVLAVLIIQIGLVAGLFTYQNYMHNRVYYLATTACYLQSMIEVTTQ